MSFKLNKTTKNFFKRSQKKIDQLKSKLKSITKKEKQIEFEEERLFEKSKKASQEVRVILSVESVVKATIAILLVIGLAYLLYYIKNILIIFLERSASDTIIMNNSAVKLPTESLQHILFPQHQQS